MIPIEPDTDNAVAGNLIILSPTHHYFMKIYVNDQQIELGNDSNLADIFQSMEIPRTGVALAVNNQVITSTEWKLFKLSDGDKILLITASAGG